jgi:predicted nuclease of predicted toxin-antitoxin system
MKLLLDANLSWRMIPILKQYFEDWFHVDHTGLNVPASDKEIWTFAKNNDLIIVTNDEDFIEFSNFNGFPPKVVLLRTGNQSRLFISNLLIQRKADIKSFYNSKETGLLEIIVAK